MVCNQLHRLDAEAFGQEVAVIIRFEEGPETLMTERNSLGVDHAIDLGPVTFMKTALESVTETGSLNVEILKNDAMGMSKIKMEIGGGTRVPFGPSRETLMALCLNP